MRYSPSRPSFARPRFRPTVESLEGRYCPSTALELPSGSPPAQSPTPTGPVITLSATVQQDRQVVLSGQVTADEPGGLTVEFSGKYTGFAVTAEDGTYSVTVEVAESGTIQASATDHEGTASNVANAPVTLPTPPSITLCVTPLDHRLVRLSGQVTDNHPEGLTVQFSGEYDGTAVTDETGHFSVTVEALNLGAIQASVTNRAGLTSNVAEDNVTSQKPTVTEFYAVREVNNQFTFYGHIDDEWAAGLQVYFGGFNSLEGQAVTVEEDGDFHFTANLASGESGLALAWITDWWGLRSDDAQTPVDPW